MHSRSLYSNSSIARYALVPRPVRTPGRVRYLTTSQAAKDKSWSEIAREVVDLAGSVANKIKDSTTSALTALVKPLTGSDKPATADRRRPSSSRSPRSRSPLVAPDADNLRDLPVLPGGLFGRALSGIFSSALSALGEELAASAKGRSDVYEQAVDRITSSRRLRSRMGEVQVGPTLQQSVSSMNINGRSSRQVNLVLPLYAAGGSGVAKVAYTQDGAAGRLDIQVQLSDGSVVRLAEGDRDDDDERGGRAVKSSAQWGGPVIVDAEFRDVK